MAHPHRLRPVEADEQAVLGADRDGRRAVLALAGRLDAATELVRHQLRPVADPEHRQAPAPDRRIRLRRPVVVDRVRPAGQDHGARAAALQLRERRVVGQQLRVDVELADAPGDQLGELAAEVEDRDEALALAGGVIGRGPLRSGCVERGLEIRLDLGVVRGEDTVARVGGLAVHRPALARHARSRPSLCRRRWPRRPCRECYRPPGAFRDDRGYPSRASWPTDGASPDTRRRSPARRPAGPRLRRAARRRPPRRPLSSHPPAPATQAPTILTDRSARRRPTEAATPAATGDHGRRPRAPPPTSRRPTTSSRAPPARGSRRWCSSRRRPARSTSSRRWASASATAASSSGSTATGSGRIDLDPRTQLHDGVRFANWCGLAAGVPARPRDLHRRRGGPGDRRVVPGSGDMPPCNGGGGPVLEAGQWAAVP